MDEKYKFKVNISGLRLDSFLAEKLKDVSRTAIQHSIKKKLVTVNGQNVKASAKLSVDDFVECQIQQKEISDNIIPQNIELDILFEDSHIIVVNKPSGLIVHPGNGNKDGTLVNGLVYHYKQLSGGNNLRPGIIHRLDKDTSGVIVIAKNDTAHSKISEQFLNRQVKKTYYALAWGRIDDNGIIEGFIARDNFNRTTFKMSDNKWRFSKTEYFLENYLEPISLVKLNPETGRTHQIRVHLKSIGHPIFSDNQYSGGKKKIKSYHVKYIQLLKFFGLHVYINPRTTNFFICILFYMESKQKKLRRELNSNSKTEMKTISI